MYRLSKDEDLRFLLNAELIQVCVGKNEVILNFDNDARITVLSDFHVRTPKFDERFSEPVLGARAVCEFLHYAVGGATATSEGDLELRFSSGGSLKIFDTSDQYESFLISFRGKEIVV
jgi:hypothetical protein